MTRRLSDNDNAPVVAGSNNEALRFLSVCSGIEAASVAWPHWQAVAFSEIEAFPSALLQHYYPDVPNLGDFTKIDTTTLGRVDILCGGTPCQAFSVAGARGGLNDPRGNLSLAFVGLAHELAGNGTTSGNGLRNVIWENVVGVLSDKTNAFGCFLGGLVGADAAIVPGRRPADGKSSANWKWSKKDKLHYPSWTRHGMVVGPKGRVAWAVKDAQFFGVAQRRRRVLVVADFGNGADPAKVLFEPESVYRNPPPRREAGQGVAAAVVPSLTASGRGVERTEEKQWPAEVASTLDTTFGPKMGLDDQHINSGASWFVPSAVSVTGDVTHALTAEGHDASEDGSGRRAPIVAFDARQPDVLVYGDHTGPLDTGQPGPAICFTAKDYGGDAAVDIAPTLRGGNHDKSHANGGVGPAVAFAQNSRDEVRLEGGDGQIAGSLSAQPGMKQQTYVAQTVSLRGREGGATAELGGSVATALRASSGGGDKPHVLVGDACLSPWDSQQKRVYDAHAEVSPALSGCDGGGGRNHPAYLLPTSAVRRLTPRECERLMGFPDDWTFIPVRKVSKANQDKARKDDSGAFREIDGEMWVMAADGPRYKALGNSWAVPKFKWLGERVQRFMPPIAANDNDNASHQPAQAA